MADMMLWDLASVSFEFRGEGLTADPVFTVTITTPVGQLHFMAEADETDDGRILRLAGAHMHSSAGKNVFGPTNLRRLGRWALQETGYDEIVIEGAVRTSGAGPGRLPGLIRFTSRAVPAAEPKP